MQGFTRTWITLKLVEKALFCQFTTKILGPNKFNFKAIRFLWSQKPDQIVAIKKNTIQLYYYPTDWKQVRGILLDKVNKRDKFLVRSHRVISLLNCIKKFVKKVVVEQLLQFYEFHQKLHKKQMRAQKSRCTVNAVTLMINSIQNVGKAKKDSGNTIYEC